MSADAYVCASRSWFSQKSRFEQCLLAIAVLFVCVVYWLASVRTKMLPKRTQNEVAENNSYLFSQIYRPTDLGWGWLDGPALRDDCLGLSFRGMATGLGTELCPQEMTVWGSVSQIPVRSSAYGDGRSIGGQAHTCKHVSSFYLHHVCLASYWPKHVTRPSPASAEWGSTLLPLMEVGWVAEDFWTIIYHMVQDL